MCKGSSFNLKNFYLYLGEKLSPIVIYTFLSTTEDDLVFQNIGTSN